MSVFDGEVSKLDDTHMAIRLHHAALGIDIVSVFDHIMFIVESCYDAEGGEGKSLTNFRVGFIS